MNILFLTSNFPYPPLDGISIKAFHVLKELFSRGHELHLLSFAANSADLSHHLTEVNKYFASMNVTRFHDDLKKLMLNIVTSSLGNDVIFFRLKSKDFAKLLRTSVKKEGFDLIHFDGVSLTQYIKVVDGLVPSVASINDSYSLWLRDKLFTQPCPTLYSVLERAYYTATFPIATAYEKNTYEKFQKVHVVSKIDGDYLRGLNTRIDIEVIPNGVDTTFFRPLGSLSKEMSLTFVARMVGENVDNSIWFIRKVFEKVKEKVPDIKLYLVGKDPNPILLSEARRVKDVIVTGYVEDVRPYIDRATLIIDPTRKRCGILNHVLQSMSMGKTVVGTKSSFLGIKGAKNWRNVIIAEDESDFVSKIIYLLRNENEKKKIGTNARLLIESEYTWEKIIFKYEKMYKEAIKKI
jgi:glycosyltransferase involved in cell wall biosynthesis